MPATLALHADQNLDYSVFTSATAAFLLFVMQSEPEKA
jgi:hypothetical protein